MLAKITQKYEIVKETLFVQLTSDEDIHFTAGQFFSLALINPPYSDSRGNSRYFGFINSSLQNKVAELVTRIGDSAFKRSLVEIPLGTEVEIGKLGGNIALPQDSAKTLVFIAGGIGIAPFMSIFRLIKEKSLGYKIILIYSNKDKASAVFLEELEAYAKENSDFKLIATMTKDNNWLGEKRRIDGNFLREYLLQHTDNFYIIAGTPRFVPSIAKMLRELGIPPQQVKFEIFTGY